MPFSENPLWYAFHQSAFIISLFSGPLEILREVSNIDRLLNDIAEMSCCTTYTRDDVSCFPSAPFLQVNHGKQYAVCKEIMSCCGPFKFLIFLVS